MDRTRVTLIGMGLPLGSALVLCAMAEVASASGCGRRCRTASGRRRRAKIRLGLQDGPNSYLTFKIAGDVHFTHGVARAKVRLDIGVAGHVLHLELPDVEMAPAEYRGDRGVEIRLPLFRREF